MFLYLLLFLVLYAITKHFFNKLQNRPKSPFPVLPIIGHLHILRKPLHRSLAKISARHGPVLFLQFSSRPVLLVSSPAAAEECLTRNDVVFANRPRLLAGKHLGNDYTNLTYASYGHHWRSLRRVVTLEILSSHRLQTLAHIRADEVRALLRRLARRRRDQTAEMKQLLFELMLNNMMRMVADKRYYGESVDDAEEAKRLHRIVNDANLLGGTSNISDFLPLPRWVLSGGYEDKLIELQKKRVSFMQSLVDERRKIMTERSSSSSGSGQEKKCMIDVLLSLQESEPDYYSDENIRGLMQTLITSGTDSSAGVMEWALTLLLTHPHVMQKAQNELDQFVGYSRLVDESDLPKLPYLLCIIKETLRLYPAGPLLPHESSEECTVGGYRIPRGTMLLVNLWAVQQDPALWDEPSKFNPERFAESEGVREGFKFIPFGFGRRSCPAENLALRMVGLTLASLVQCFEWDVISKDEMDMTERLGISLTKAHSLQAKCRPRQTMLNVLSQI